MSIKTLNRISGQLASILNNLTNDVGNTLRDGSSNAFRSLSNEYSAFGSKIREGVSNSVERIAPLADELEELYVKSKDIAGFENIFDEVDKACKENEFVKFAFQEHVLSSENPDYQRLIINTTDIFGVEGELKRKTVDSYVSESDSIYSTIHMNVAFQLISIETFNVPVSVSNDYDESVYDHFILDMSFKLIEITEYNESEVDVTTHNESVYDNFSAEFEWKIVSSDIFAGVENEEEDPNYIVINI